MPLYPALTVGELELRLAESMGDLLFDATATAGAASTITAAALPWNANDDEGIIGAWVRLYAGTSAGDERQAIAPYTASTGLVTADRAWTATPDTTTKLYITRQHRPTQYQRALQDAQRYQAQRRISLLPVIGREVIVGNLVPNGTFDLYTTADTPDGGFAIAGTPTEETTITLGPRSCLKLVSAANTAASVRFSLPRWGVFKGKTVRCYAWVRPSNASLTTLEFADGVGSATTDTATTNSVWELLEISRSFSDAATQARPSVEIAAAGAGVQTTTYVQFLYVPDPDPHFEQAAMDADRSLVAIGGLRLSNGSVLGSSVGRGYGFGDALRPKNFSIFEDTEDTPRLLRLDIAGAYRGHVLEYQGWKIHPEFTAVTTSYAGTPELLLPRARAILLRNVGADAGEVMAAEATADRAERDLAVRIPMGYRAVMSQ